MSEKSMRQRTLRANCRRSNFLPRSRLKSDPAPSLALWQSEEVGWFGGSGIGDLGASSRIEHASTGQELARRDQDVDQVGAQEPTARRSAVLVSSAGLRRDSTAYGPPLRLYGYTSEEIDRMIDEGVIPTRPH
jgi:hypothetical protein